MVWQTTCPDGSLSVANNNTIIQQNTTYIKTTMNKDHYWNVGANEDGHHKWVQTVATNDAAPSVITDAPLSTGMDLVYYSRFKTPTEAITAGAQTCQPFALNNTSIMQLLGIQACVLFNVDQSTNAISIVYYHNVSGVVRNSTGDYTISYSNNLPTAGYLVFSGGIRPSSGGKFLISSVKGSGTLTEYKKLNECTIVTGSQSANVVDPLQVWAVMFGG